jgi:phage host-nuclease inhibitor protein Gam
VTNSQAFDDDILKVPTTLDDVDALLKRRGKNSATVRDALAVEGSANEKAAETRAQVVKIPKQQNALIDEMIAQYVTRHRKGLLGRFGRTINLSNGVIKVRVIRKSVELPVDTKPVIQWLLAHRFGKQKVRMVPEVDKVALLASSPGYIRKLHPLGVWVGRHENISIQANDEERSTIISHRRYRQRRHQ